MAERISPLAERRVALSGGAAFIWSIAFAALNFYWALGGTAGSATIGQAITDLANDPAFTIILWVTAVMKALLGLLALVLIRPPVRRIPRRVVLTFGWAAGIGMVLYGGASFIQHALMLTGAVHLPDGLGVTAARWHLALWDPWWLLGGILFVAVTWFAARMDGQGNF